VPGLVQSLTDPVLISTNGKVLLAAREGLFQVAGDKLGEVTVQLPETALSAAVAEDGDFVVAISAIDGSTIASSRSTDAGASWEAGGTAQLQTEGGIAEISAAVSGERLVVLANETSSSNFSFGAWAVSSDRGDKWTTGQAPSGGKVSVADGNFWIVGGVTGSELYVSSDGEKWGKVSLPVTGSFTAQSPTTVPGFGVVVPITRRSSKGGDIAFLTSPDGGKTWKESASTSAPVTEDGSTIPTAVAATGQWWAIWPDGSKVVFGTVGESEINFISPNGLPNVMSVALSGDSLIALASINECPSGKSSCASTVVLEVSSDGGQTWKSLE
jgi:hypothetical protein